MLFFLGAVALGALGLVASLYCHGHEITSQPKPRETTSRRTAPDQGHLSPDWEPFLLPALEHIYAGQPSSAIRQSHRALEKPSAIAAAHVLSLMHSFEKIGSLHSSLAALDNPNTSLKEIGDLVTHDPVLTARVLKTVNSPLFYLASGVKSVHTAVTILGVNNLKNLISLGLLPQKLYTSARQRRMFMHIWQHMNTTAILASHMAKTQRGLDSGTMYTAGLMHDVGKLVLSLMLPETWQDYPPTIREEHALLAATHLYAGKIIAENGRFPEQLLFLIENHHQPSILPVQQLQCNAEQAKSMTILFLANQIAKLITPDGNPNANPEHLEQLEPSYQEILSKREAQKLLLDPGLANDVLTSVRVVRGSLG
ncbi:MAG: HDOD domain-containing protein [Deltaproteobacteria bacterium]|nr:HDOD domain-containing protein [Deltaproteobacteria bacterium]